MKDIICQDCKKKVGEVEEDSMIISSDPFYGIDIYCNKCKEKHINDFREDENQLVN